MGRLEFGILRTGFPYGPVVWDFRTLFNIETVGAQSQQSVRERTLRIKYYSQRSHLSRIKGDETK